MKKVWIHLYLDGTYAVNYTQASADLQGKKNCITTVETLIEEEEAYINLLFKICPPWAAQSEHHV